VSFLCGKYLKYIKIFLKFDESEIEINGAVMQKKNFFFLKVICMLFMI